MIRVQCWPSAPPSSWLVAWVGTSGGGGGQYGSAPPSSWARGSFALMFCSAHFTVGLDEAASARKAVSIACTVLVRTIAWVLPSIVSTVEGPYCLNFVLTSEIVLPSTGCTTISPTLSAIAGWAGWTMPAESMVTASVAAPITDTMRRLVRDQNPLDILHPSPRLRDESAS